ncbi:MAG: right-handed parallel beta-helix repeat-containing protein [Planctomycetota bacterium]
MKVTPPRSALSIATLALASALGGGLLVSLLAAGPLNPPGGAVTSTYKTLTEVEPRTAINAANTPGDADSLFKITQPGSYYLTGNITGAAGKHGVEIATSGVTLDLNGFDLVGAGGFGTSDGVSVTAGGLSHIAVVNGSVRGWADEGVDLGTFGAFNCRIVDVLTSDNSGHGISAGNNCTVTGCSAYQNAGIGIFTSIAGTISNCSAYVNANTGIATGDASTISNCTASYNGNFGLTTGIGSTVSSCTARTNGVSGIYAAGGSTVLGSSANSNSGDGITAIDGCTITNCTAADNATRGIGVNNGCQITACTTRNNLFDGIVVNYACVVSGNNCNGDGTAAGTHGGIRVLGQANRVESNNVTYAQRGFLVDSGGNVIARNTATGCTVNWVVVAGNKCLVVAGVNSAAINGSSGGVSPGSTDPSANYSY